MKKTLFAVVTAAVVLFGATNVHAMTEDQLREKLSGTFEVNGKEVRVPEEYLLQMENYLDKYDLSDNDANYISDKIDEAISSVKSGAKSFSELTSAERQKMVSIVADIREHTSVKATLTDSVNGAKLVIYEADGVTPFAVIEDKIKETGVNNSITLIASAISVLGLAFVVKKVAKANA